LAKIETKEKKSTVKPNEKFVHLHVHTHYSLLDGMCKIPKLLDRAVEYGMPSVAITDHGVMYGAIEFYKECKKRNLQPIIGCEMYMAPRTLNDKTPKIDAHPGHLVLLAKNLIGYKNLMKLTTIAHIDGYYYKPRIDREVLAKYCEGLVAMSACTHGDFTEKLVAGDKKKAKETYEFYKSLFGDDFYIEIQYNPGYAEQDRANDLLIKFAKENGAQLVASKDVHYVDKDDREAHDALICVQTGKLMADEDRMKFQSDQSFVAPAEMKEYFKDTPEAVANTLKIVEKCKPFVAEFDLPYYERNEFFIPNFDLPDGYSLNSYIEKLVADGIKKKYGKETKEIKDRVAYELGVIKKMKYVEYFLVVADYVTWAKDNGILVGPGRGSGAGSIVAYAMDITELDPLKYDLLFERFLNPDRISMPDFDMDFADDRRHEVIQYVVEKYGSDKVAQIITFGTMAQRNAIRDVGRVLGMSYGEVDAVAKVTPSNMTLEQSVKEIPELAAFYKMGGEYKKLLDLAQRLEGVARHSSTHAAGVVISRDDLVGFTPLQKAAKGDISTNTQYEMHAIEDLGLLKMDFLGLSNLTVLKNALRIIKKVYGEEIDLAKLPEKDEKTFKLLAKAQTTGVFQLESSGMKRYLRELKPTVFEDIVAMVALYRPGPMENIPEFIDRKHGRKEVTYAHPVMEKALSNTYGIIVYQEQVMQLSKDMAGFTGGQADTLRKAMGKKIAALMKKMKVDFIDGCVANKVDKKIAEATFDSMESFAAYAFNKSHAACYALISYWTAYLKAHYPSAFMAALMTSDYGNIDRITIEVSEAQDMKIEVLGPDVNESYYEFSVVPKTNQIRFGLAAVKNVGTGIIRAIEDARNEGGKFTTVEDFLTRVRAGEINKKVMDSLIKAGAFDTLGDRSTLLFNLERILGFAQKIQKGTADGQLGLFGEEHKKDNNSFGLSLSEPEEKLNSEERLAFEKELLGIYFSEHPLDAHLEKLESLNIRPIMQITEMMADKDVRIGGVITGVQKILTRKNEPMAFAYFEDKTGKIELILFPKTLVKYQHFIRDGALLYVKGKVNIKDGQMKLLVDTIEDLKTKEGERQPKTVRNFVDLDDFATINVPRGMTDADLASLKLLLAKNKGSIETYVVIPNGGEPKRVKMPFGIDYTDEVISEINTVLSRRG
jgi:DNA polymerase III subunit alpha